MLTAKDFGYDVIRSYPTYDLCLCPFHNDSNPSALFSRNSLQFRCLGCGKVVNHNSGNGYIGSEFETEAIVGRFDLIPQVTNYLQGSVAYLDADLMFYLAAREISPAVALHYGCWQSNYKGRAQIVFPQYDLNNQLLGTVKRWADFDPSGQRYFIDGQRAAVWPISELNFEKINFLSEGAFKAMALYQAATFLESDILTSMATMGSLLRKETKELILQNPSSFVFLADNDDAGLKFGYEMKALGCRVFKLKKPFDNMHQEERNQKLLSLLERIQKDNVCKGLG